MTSKLSMCDEAKHKYRQTYLRDLTAGAVANKNFSCHALFLKELKILEAFPLSNKLLTYSLVLCDFSEKRQIRNLENDISQVQAKPTSS